MQVRSITQAVTKARHGLRRGGEQALALDCPRGNDISAAQVDQAAAHAPG